MKKVIALIALSLLVVQSIGVVRNEAPNYAVIDNLLEKKLNEVDDDHSLEVLIQFKGEIRKSDRNRLEELNFKVLKSYDSLPLIFAMGSKESILKLSSYSRTHWIEWNAPLVNYMDKSVYVINATETWERYIRQRDNTTSPPIDGSGVTVAIVDSGIDASHPDLRYQEKVLKNVKRDTQAGVWREKEDTDTSSGHGTHCAGTVAGDGRASAGKYRGVAYGANLIGISMGEGPFTIDEFDALDWVYQNSKPNANPYNIRVVSDSWGPGTSDELDPEDAIIQIIEKLTYENNVVVVFAAGNDGENNHDGSEVTTNIYGNVPAAISVAAAEHDGSGIASFSSRGKKGMPETYPDVSAPGVRITSTADRATLIGLLTAQQREYYYFAISGTSMATPHVAGAVALLWQACPSLKVSDVKDDSRGKSKRIHEAEWILKATADYIEPNGKNGVPEDYDEGLGGRKHDFAQGYGLINVERAVAVALTLNELRMEKDYATVDDALRQYENVMTEGIAEERTNTIFTQWQGVWSRFINQTTNKPYYADQTRIVYIPEYANKLILDLEYEPFKTGDEKVAGTLGVTIDYDNDGNPDWEQDLWDYARAITGLKHNEFDLTQGEFASHKGTYWTFNIQGQGVGIDFQLMQIIEDFSVSEIKIDYTTTVQLVLEMNQSHLVEFDANATNIARFDFGAPVGNYSYGTIKMHRLYYDMNNVVPSLVKEGKEEHFEIDLNLLLGIIAVAVLLGLIGYGYYLRHKGEERKEED